MVPPEELFVIETSAFADQSCFAAEAKNLDFASEAAYCVEGNLSAAANPIAVVGLAEIVAVTSTAAVTAIVTVLAARHLAIKKHFGSVAELHPFVVASCVLSVDSSAC